MLNCVLHGTATEHPPLLIVHGLFGSAKNWGVIAKRLSNTRQVIAVDMRNHGGSFWSDVHDYPALANDLAEVIAAHGGRADVLGHSMGGKAAMMLASSHPEAVHRLIVADIAPVGYGHTQVHLIHAMRRLELDGVSRRSEADALLTKDIPDAGTRAFLLQSLDLPNKSWRLNLDVLEAEMLKIIGWPGSEAQFLQPTLFLAGGDSDYVTPNSRPAIRALFPKARFAKIPGAGHWLHAEKPREFEAAVRTFLDARASG